MGLDPTRCRPSFFLSSPQKPENSDPRREPTLLSVAAQFALIQGLILRDANTYLGAVAPSTLCNGDSCQNYEQLDNAARALDRMCTREGGQKRWNLGRCDGTYERCDSPPSRQIERPATVMVLESR